MKLNNYTKLFLLVLIVALLLRITFITIDSPSWATGDMGLYADEGYKTLNARNYALFGVTHPHELDSYPGWSKLSPVSHFLFVSSFQLFGTGYVQARLVNILFSVASIVLTFFLVLKMTNRKTALVASVFLAVNISYLIYNKIALLETPLTFFLLLSCYFYLLAKDKPYWILGSCASFVLAFLTKPLAILFVPALGFMVYDIFSHKISRKFIITSLVGGAGIILIALMLFPQIIDIVIGFAIDRSPDSLSLVLSLLYQFWYQDFFRLNSLLLFFFLGYCVHYIVRLSKKKVSSPETALLLWALGGIVLLIIQTYRPARYFVTLIPALCILAALFLTTRHTIPKQLWVKALLGVAGVIVILHIYYFAKLIGIPLLLFAGIAALLGLLVVFVLPKLRMKFILQHSLIGLYLLVQIIFISVWFIGGTYNLVNASADLENIVGEDEVVFGSNWVPALCLDTDLECYHVSGIHNEGVEAFRNFDVDYFLMDDIEQLKRDEVPFALEPTFENSLTYVTSYPVGRFTIDLYKFDQEVYYSR